MIEVAIAFVAVLICIGIHYEALAIFSRWMPRLPGIARIHVSFAIAGAMVAHVLEIIIWAAALGGAQAAGIGELSPPTTGLADLFYASANTYTSLGYGDIVPLGRLRVIASLEALTGLVMIAWTASFTYFQMERYWPAR